MAENENTLKCFVCPYLATQSKQCIICKEGLFIPGDDHVQTYCNSKNYNQCIHYGLRPSNQVELINAAQNQALTNRRRHERIQAKHKITLMKVYASVSFPESQNTTLGQTVDLSMGGMRLITDLPLANDTLIQFSFDESFPAELQLGTGQIAWCNKLIDQPGYQSGVIFQGNQLIQAMNTFLMVNN